MINTVYQLVAPRTIAVKFEDVPLGGRVVVRPLMMAVCHADQRYYQGRRDPAVLRRKLPMALIHECVAQVLWDPTRTFSAGEQVALIPNIPGHGPAGVYENYAAGSGFRSSGHDGFMRELVDLPVDRVVGCEGVDLRVAAMTEFVSVACHAARRFDKAAHLKRDRVAIVGDGASAYTLACVLTVLAPATDLVVIGHNADKLALFSFAAERWLTYEAPASLSFDHAFECAGGEGSASAIDFVIDHIAPQGALMLMGVSEQPVPVRTRDVLEKGLMLVGCSRSGREDFEQAVAVLREPGVQARLRQIIHVDDPVRSVKDIKRVFATDQQTPFKTVFRWGL